MTMPLHVRPLLGTVLSPGLPTSRRMMRLRNSNSGSRRTSWQDA